MYRMEAKIVLSSRPKELLVHNNNDTYRKYKTLNSDDVYWR
jgi:hypothetical protein